MATFSYVVARFVPDMMKNEPVNVGVLVQTEKNKFSGKFIENFRTLSQRYRNVNIKAIQGILDSLRDDHNAESYDYLSKLAKDFQYQLIFTKPTSIVAGSPQMALNELFESFISIESKIRPRKVLTRLQLRSKVRKEIDQKLERKWVITKHKVKGPKDHFEFDFAFKNGKVSDLLHTISFAGNAKRALTLAKALALTVNYVIQENEDMACSALIHPPTKEKDASEYFEPAIGYLKDQECAVKTEEEIPVYVSNIKQKLSSHN